MDTVNYKVEKYCTACGNGLIASAAICPNCGTATGTIVNAGSKGKDKTVAVLLAVFLSFWTYLYTWSVDKTRFVVAISVTAFAVLILWVALIVEEVDYYWEGISIIPAVLYSLVSFVFWIIALVRTVKRGKEFYVNYVRNQEG